MPKKPKGELMMDLHVRVPANLIADVDALADKAGLPRPEFIRRTLQGAVDEKKEQATLDQVLARLEEIDARLRKVEGDE
jgi:metal-responsive CopG/Arc/MetJ family transcriptional regulator